MTQYLYHEEHGRLSMTDMDSRYELHLELSPSYYADGFWCMSQIIFRAPYDMGVLPITARDLKDYPESVRSLPIDPSKTHIEVGAGLGGFIQHVTAWCKPIAIDPAKYDVMERMLSDVHGRRLPRYVMNRLEVLLERCALIRDRNRVHLLNMTLGNALERHPELLASADVVVDHFGATEYVKNEDLAPAPHRDQALLIAERERQLLKPEGRLFLHF
ncbi:hypothetical protein HY639_05605 [Candidatus Woesearchaeota archaeon]|nr:hypothetical protein [Candidatus Woesearchaeota archaeon]